MSQPADQRVWVIGAGFLGAEVAAMCRAAGAATLRMDPAAPAEVQGCAWEAAALARAQELLPNPQVVYGCMATHGGDAQAYRLAYVESVARLVEAVPRARLVFCSSTSLYGGPGEVTEESPTRTESERAQILQEAEELVRQSGGVVARLAPMYGSGRCELLRRHLAGEPRLPGAPSRVLNYVHVQDAARALLLLGTLSPLPHRVYNVCAESFSKEEVYTLLERQTGVPLAPQVAAHGRRGAADHRVCAERLRSLGWAPQMAFARYVAEAGAS